MPWPTALDVQADRRDDRESQPSEMPASLSPLSSSESSQVASEEPQTQQGSEQSTEQEEVTHSLPSCTQDMQDESDTVDDWSEESEREVQDLSSEKPTQLRQPSTDTSQHHVQHGDQHQVLHQASTQPEQVVQCEPLQQSLMWESSPQQSEQLRRWLPQSLSQQKTLSPLSVWPLWPSLTLSRPLSPPCLCQELV